MSGKMWNSASGLLETNFEMKKLMQIFESRYASISCMIFAFINRVIFETLYASIGMDARLQITFAKNFLEGKGMGVTKYFSTDLNHPIFDTTQHFPPGFSFAVIPFLQLFHNEYSAMFAFDIVNIFIFLFAIRMLSKNVGLPTGMSNILMLTAGCSQYAFFIIGSCTDLISLTLVLLNLSFLIKIMSRQSLLKPIAILVYGFFFFLPFFFRYMYLPVSLLFPAMIYMWGVVYKKADLKRNGLLLLIAVSFFILLMMFLSFYFSGNFLHVTKTERGIFFDQLVQYYPFIPASFVNLDFLSQLIVKLGHITYTDAFELIKLANILLFLFLLFRFIRFLILLKKQQPTRASLFIVNGSLISLCILSVLTYFSLTYKSQIWGSIQLWNYNNESRYFAFIYIFLPFVLLLCLSVYKATFKKILFKGLIFGGLFLLFLEIIHGIYYNVKIISKQKDIIEIKNHIAEVDYWQFPSMLETLAKEYPQQPILVSACNPMLLNIASQMGYKTIFDYANLNKVNLRVNKKSLLLFPLQEDDTSLMREYLQKKKPLLIKKVGNTSFYLEQINPE